MANNVILVTDIECDGNQIGRNSMRSFCTVAVNAQTLEIIDIFDVNLRPLQGATENFDTVETFFKGQFPEAWADLLINPQDPKQAMNNYLDWLDSLKADRKIFCASPISYDKAWMVWYTQEFCADRLPVNPHSPFDLSDFELKSFQAGLLGLKRDEFKSSHMPMAWQSPLPHTHIARDDAKKEADELIRTLKWAKARQSIYNALLK